MKNLSINKINHIAGGMRTMTKVHIAFTALNTLLIAIGVKRCLSPAESATPSKIESLCAIACDTKASYNNLAAQYNKLYNKKVFGDLNQE